MSLTRERMFPRGGGGGNKGLRQFRIAWNLDYGFQSLVGFRIR